MTETCGSTWHHYVCGLPAGHPRPLCQQRDQNGHLIAVWAKGWKTP